MTRDEIRTGYAGMTPEERRAALPAWFTGDFDPSYPDRSTLFGDEGDKLLGHLIADAMGKFEAKLPDRRRKSGLAWLDHADDVQRLIEACRLIYYPAYHDWLERNAPAGSRWRPWRTLGKNDAGGPRHDYTDWPGPTAADALRRLGVTSWSHLFAEDHEKAINPAKCRRPSKDGSMQYGLGIFEDRPIGTAPMKPVYELTKRFYVKVLGMRAFRPEYPFTGDVVGKEYDAEQDKVVKRLGGNRSRAAIIKRDDMNTAAKFLSFVLKEVDDHFDARQSGLVARAFYKRT